MNLHDVHNKIDKIAGICQDDNFQDQATFGMSHIDLQVSIPNKSISFRVSSKINIS